MRKPRYFNKGIYTRTVQTSVGMRSEMKRAERMKQESCKKVSASGSMSSNLEFRHQLSTSYEVCGAEDPHFCCLAVNGEHFRTESKPCLIAGSIVCMEQSVLAFMSLGSTSHRCNNSESVAASSHNKKLELRGRMKVLSLMVWNLGYKAKGMKRYVSASVRNYLAR